MNQYKLMLDNKSGTEIDVELDGFASLVSYNRQTYKWSEYAQKYLPIDAIPVRKVRSKNDPSLLSDDIIVAIKTEINDIEGYKATVRNRDGKQYLTVKSPHVFRYDESRKVSQRVLDKYAPKAQHTSGGGGEHTYRLNALWVWFVTPLGVPAIGILQAYGILLLVGMFTFPSLMATMMRTQALLTEDAKKRIEWLTPILIIIVSWLTVLIGFGASLFM